uniref:Dystroglycan 1 n=1 Tax=Anopheles culicifacies TaxID=139723 RepID=A0A182MJB9_9DIPT
MEMDEDEDSSEPKQQYVDEVDSKTSTFVSPDVSSTTTTGSNFGGEEIDSLSGTYTVTTISNVPLTTVRQQERNRFVLPNRTPFGKKLDQTYSNEDEDDLDEEEDIEDDEEDDYFSQGPIAESEKDIEYENYDDEYDDEEEEGAVEITTVSVMPDPRLLSSTSTTTEQTLSSSTELDEPTNLPPTIRNRIPKQAIPAGKIYRYQISLETFYDNEDGNNLQLELLDSHDQPLKTTSWIQFNEDTKEIYGLPLENDVSRWSYRLRATDSGNLTVTEKVDIMVQQHKSYRSLNHEISLALRLNRKFASNVDWHMEIARAISLVLGDVTPSNIIVRDFRNSIQDPSLATFVYTNETLPKDRCPEEKLDELVARLTEEALNDALNPDITVKSVQGQQIAQCTKPTIPKAKPTQSISRNSAPQTRNQVDQVNATVGHLLVFKVPVDTFYDHEDGNELKMKLLTTDRHTLDPYHWLQFDSKNQEFYGVPRTNDIGRKEYLLMAEDREGLTATDALVVVVNAHHKRDYSVLFELTLDITHEQFITAQVQRRFIERLAQVFGDASTHYIKIHHIRPIHHTGQVQVSFFNTTLNRQHQRCPQEEIEALRNILLHQDSTIRAKVREILGQEFSLQNVSLVPLDNCHGFDTPLHATSEPEKAAPKPMANDDYMLTFVVPTVVIIVMLLFAGIIGCILYKRRLTGKMELGTDEERKSFRSKGIPVIFQDELDEKPEIGNKSPVILKDEKPPLLPPSYSSTNNDGENEDVDEYVPPQPVIVGGRESRGKSPVTPSYRRPPPYVSP